MLPRVWSRDLCLEWELGCSFGCQVSRMVYTCPGRVVCALSFWIDKRGCIFFTFLYVFPIKNDRTTPKMVFFYILKISKKFSLKGLFKVLGFKRVFNFFRTPHLCKKSYARLCKKNLELLPDNFVPRKSLLIDRERCLCYAKHTCAKRGSPTPLSHWIKKL